jgi:hypothetical protein
MNVISGFRREVAVSCALLGYYAASSGNLPTFRDNHSVQFSVCNLEASFDLDKQSQNIEL